MSQVESKAGPSSDLNCSDVVLRQSSVLPIAKIASEIRGVLTHITVNVNII